MATVCRNVAAVSRWSYHRFNPQARKARIPQTESRRDEVQNLRPRESSWNRTGLVYLSHIGVKPRSIICTHLPSSTSTRSKWVRHCPSGFTVQVCCLEGVVNENALGASYSRKQQFPRKRKAGSCRPCRALQQTRLLAPFRTTALRSL